MCTLDPIIFKQPEGITFTPWGDLLISNEAVDKYGNATLLIFKPKKKYNAEKNPTLFIFCYFNDESVFWPGGFHTLPG